MTRRPSGATSIHKVREMFAAVSLPLCDDGAAIQSAADTQRSARNRELNSTKGTAAVRAQAWFEQVDALLKKREQLLAGAYQDFVSLGDAVLGAAGFGGKRRVAKGGRRALLDLAQSWCGAREDLADYWVERFMKERKLGTRPVGVGARQKLTGLSHQPDTQESSGPGPQSSRTSRQTQPVVNKQKRKLQAPVASASPIALAAKLPTPERLREGSAARAAETSKASAAQPDDEQAKSGSGRMLAIAGSVLAVAAVLGAASQGLIPLDFANGSSNPAQASADLTLTAAVITMEAQQTDDESSTIEVVDEPLDDQTESQPMVADSDSTEARSVPGLSASEQAPERQPAPAEQAPAPQIAPWTAWIIEPPSQAFAGQSLHLRLECDSLPDGRLHDLQLQGLKVRSIELTAAHTEVQFDVMPLPEDHYDGLATWSFTLKDDLGLVSQRIQGQCQVLPPAR